MIDVVVAYWNLASGMISLGLSDGGIYWFDFVIGVWFLLMPAVIVSSIVALLVDVLSRARAKRARKIQAAKRRHPSARTAPDLSSDAARRYHGSDQWGR